ncbi:MAG: extracellular solute-binding protein [Lachnospiraceae bacterium]|nr:extracellular solute-binding protein [Lachnospiraceae bacterium]
MKIRCMNCMEQYDDEYELCPHCGYIRDTAPDEIYQMKSGITLHDRYKVGVVVGFGGFGITYKAWDTKMDKVVAIKEYFPSSLVNRGLDGISVNLYSEKNREEFDKGLIRFLEEGKRTAMFGEHPNIVNVYDLFQENNTGYIIMEFLDGISLKDFILLNEGRIDTDTAIDVLLSVIAALKTMHKEKILHRDISPDNIFICLNKKIKLIDFGAARISDEEEKTMSVVLKPGYAPPEQYRNKSIQGPWTDIYALGATMYYAITGVVPDESVDRVVNDEVKSPKELNPEVPDYIDTALMVAMALTPELRFQNVTQFEEAILHQRKVRTVEQDLKRRKRTRLVVAGIVTAVLLMAVLITVGIYNKIKFDAELEATKILVWIPASEEDMSTAEQNFYSRIAQFQTDYPHIEVEVEVIAEGSYYDKLDLASEKGNLPDLFVSTYASDEILDNTIKLDDVFNAVDKKDLYLMSDYKDYFPDKNQMPTGLDMAIAYGSEITDSISNENDMDLFLAGEAGVVVSGTKDYNLVQSTFGGKYEILIDEVYGDEDIQACFVDVWSVSAQCEDKNQAAAMRVISYLLGDMGQDVYYNQDANGTPLNKNCFVEYIKINWELKELESYMDNIYVDDDSLFELDEVCDKIYQEKICE